MTERIALLLERRDGSVVSVVCNSREAADKIGKVTPHEVVGYAPIVSRVDAILPV